MIRVSDLLNQLNVIAPFSDSEDWDNTGLLVGDASDAVEGVLTALDCSLNTVDEAIMQGANVIVSHHPLIFPEISNVVNDGPGKVIRKLIKNDINLIAMHTNLDHQPDGVSHMIAAKLGFDQTEILFPHEGSFKKLRVNINAEDKESFKQNLLKNAPVGNVGDYTEVSYEYTVHGQFKPEGEANPTIGEVGKLEHVEEYVVECIFEGKHKDDVVAALKQYHPYEEPVYDIFSIDKAANTGLGVKFSFGDTLDSLIDLLENRAEIKVVNVVKGNDKIVGNVGIIGGSGMSYADAAFSKGIDVLVTGDVKYHEAYDAKAAGQNIIDAGHYLEAVMVSGLAELLAEKIDVKVIASNVSTNPFE